MSKNQTDETFKKWTNLAKKDIVVGEGRTAGIIKASHSDCAFGYVYSLPGGETTRSKKHATKVAAHINWLLCKAA